MAESSVRHFIDVEGQSDAVWKRLVARAVDLAAGAVPARLDQAVVNLFLEPSTRTRVSFELAASRLGLRVVNMELDRSSSTKGESLEDTVATLASMGIQAAIIRHPQTGRCQELLAGLPADLRLLNAGDGSGHHPSQALLDAATLIQAGVRLEGCVVAIVGDIRHSRVARSGLALFRRLGVRELRVAGPELLLPEWLPGDVQRCASLEQALAGADAVMMLRIQHERMDSQTWPDPGSYHAEWGLTAARLALARPGCKVLHPGPINRGVEISSDVADGPNSLILAQVRMGVFARMAVFEWLFGAET